MDFDSLKDDSLSNTPSPQGRGGGVAPVLPSFDDLKDDSVRYGSGPELLKTAVEQGLSGLTLGASKVAETKLFNNASDIAGRERANPITATVSNIAGTGALLAGTGGLSAFGEGAGVAGRIGLSGLEGAGIGGANQVFDDWSQNKPLDAQKIAASSGLGALLGTAGGALAEGIGAFRANRLAKASASTENQAANATASAAEAASAPIVPEEGFKGVKDTSLENITNQVNQAKINNTGVALPAQAELEDALSRVGMDNPVNRLQYDSLGSREARDIYQTAKDAPGKVGPALANYEGIQKAELVDKLKDAVLNISPGFEPKSDAYQGGKYAIDAFTDQYQAEKEALSPLFEKLKSIPVEGELLPDSVIRMTKAVPDIASMFDASGDTLTVKPVWKSGWGIAKDTYNAVKEAVDTLSTEEDSFKTLWNARKGFDEHINVLTQGQAPRQIRALKAALMDQMQDLSENPEIRDIFRRYAINEQQREVIEKVFGASVGTPEFGQISKIKPEVIGDKIFSNTATVDAAKNILGPEQYNSILQNWIAEAQAKVTDKGAFSSNKFGSFLRNNQDALNVAFKDNPDLYQRMKDLTLIARILPDAPPINPSGTAKTLSRMILGNDINVHNLTWEGMLASVPKKIAAEINNRLKMNELNNILSGQALKNAQSASLKSQSAAISNKIDLGVRALFGASASQARKVSNGR